MQSIKDRFNKQGTFKIDNEDALIRIHHILMKEYGWIPVKEYQQLSLPTIFNLLNCIQEDRKEEERQAKKSRKR